MRYTILLMSMWMALSCTKENKNSKESASAEEIVCTWQVMETYPEQVRGDCHLDTSKDTIEVSAYDLEPLMETLTVEINGKVLDAQHRSYNAETKSVIIKELAEDMRNGKMRISYTAKRPAP